MNWKIIPYISLTVNLEPVNAFDRINLKEYSGKCSIRRPPQALKLWTAEV